jgi:DNA-binding CsgD family transcriptional regulator
MRMAELASMGVEGLSLVEDRPAGVQVALAGLPPIYRHGLAAGLSAAGMSCTALASTAELPGLLGRLAARARAGADARAATAFVILVAASQSAGIDPLVRDGTATADRTDRPVGVDGSRSPGNSGNRGSSGNPGKPGSHGSAWGTSVSSVATVHVVEEVTAEAFANALQAGATGVIPMDAGFDQVVAVVKAASAGLTLLPRLMAKALCRPQAGPPPQLLPRERRWLRHLADSGTVGSLAGEAGYSEREMYRLLGGLYGRLGASNRTEALLLAERWGMLQDQP